MPLFRLVAANETAWQIFAGSPLGEIGLLILMIGLVLSLVAREERQLVLLPIVFLILGVFFTVISGLFTGFGADKFLSFVATFCLNASVGRTGFLLVVTVLRRTIHWTPQKIYLDVAMAAIYVMVVISALSKAQVKSSDLVTSTAVLTGIIALAAQGTLGNIFAGLAIHLHHPFSVGDWIQFDDKREHIGKVKEISWRATTVVTLDAVEVVVPNSKLAEMPLTNFMRPELWSRRSIYFVCPYHVPPARVHSIVISAIVGSRGVLQTPTPTIVTNAFTERGIEYWLRFFTVDLDTRDGVDGGVRDRIWYALDRNGIAMPPTVNTVELTEVTPESRQTMERIEVQRREVMLKSLFLFQDLPEPALATLARESLIRRYLANEVVIRQDETGSELFVIQAGTVQVTVAEKGTAPVEVSQLKTGEYFGEMSLILGEPRSATVTATTACEFLVIGKNGLAAVFTEFPNLVDTVSETMSTRRKELESRLAESPLPVETSESTSLLARIKQYFNLQ